MNLEMGRDSLSPARRESSRRRRDSRDHSRSPRRRAYSHDHYDDGGHSRSRSRRDRRDHSYSSDDSFRRRRRSHSDGRRSDSAASSFSRSRSRSRSRSGGRAPSRGASSYSSGASYRRRRNDDDNNNRNGNGSNANSLRPFSSTSSTRTQKRPREEEGSPIRSEEGEERQTNSTGGGDASSFHSFSDLLAADVVSAGAGGNASLPPRLPALPPLQPLRGGEEEADASGAIGFGGGAVGAKSRSARQRAAKREKMRNQRALAFGEEASVAAAVDGAADNGLFLPPLSSGGGASLPHRPTATPRHSHSSAGTAPADSSAAAAVLSEYALVVPPYYEAMGLTEANVAFGVPITLDVSNAAEGEIRNNDSINNTNGLPSAGILPPPPSSSAAQQQQKLLTEGDLRYRSGYNRAATPPPPYNPPHYLEKSVQQQQQQEEGCETTIEIKGATGGALPPTAPLPLPPFSQEEHDAAAARFIRYAPSNEIILTNVWPFLEEDRILRAIRRAVAVHEGTHDRRYEVHRLWMPRRRRIVDEADGEEGLGSEGGEQAGENDSAAAANGTANLAAVEAPLPALSSGIASVLATAGAAPSAATAAATADDDDDDAEFDDFLNALDSDGDEDDTTKQSADAEKEKAKEKEKTGDTSSHQKTSETNATINAAVAAATPQIRLESYPQPRNDRRQGPRPWNSARFGAAARQPPSAHALIGGDPFEDEEFDGIPICTARNPLYKPGGALYCTTVDRTNQKNNAKIAAKANADANSASPNAVLPMGSHRGGVGGGNGPSPLLNSCRFERTLDLLDVRGDLKITGLVPLLRGHCHRALVPHSNFQRVATTNTTAHSAAAGVLPPPPPPPFAPPSADGDGPIGYGDEDGEVSGGGKQQPANIQPTTTTTALRYMLPSYPPASTTGTAWHFHPDGPAEEQGTPFAVIVSFATTLDCDRVLRALRSPFRRHSRCRDVLFVPHRGLHPLSFEARRTPYVTSPYVSAVTVYPYPDPAACQLPRQPTQERIYQMCFERDSVARASGALGVVRGVGWRTDAESKGLSLDGLDGSAEGRGGGGKTAATGQKANVPKPPPEPRVTALHHFMADDPSRQAELKEFLSALYDDFDNLHEADKTFYNAHMKVFMAAATAAPPPPSASSTTTGTAVADSAAATAAPLSLKERLALKKAALLEAQRGNGVGTADQPAAAAEVASPTTAAKDSPPHDSDKTAANSTPKPAEEAASAPPPAAAAPPSARELLMQRLAAKKAAMNAPAAAASAVTDAQTSAAEGAEGVPPTSGGSASTDQQQSVAAADAMAASASTLLTSPTGANQSSGETNGWPHQNSHAAVDTVGNNGVSDFVFVPDAPVPLPLLSETFASHGNTNDDEDAEVAALAAAHRRLAAAAAGTSALLCGGGVAAAHQPIGHKRAREEDTSSDADHRAIVCSLDRFTDWYLRRSPLPQAAFERGGPSAADEASSHAPTNGGANKQQQQQKRQAPSAGFLYGGLAPSLFSFGFPLPPATQTAIGAALAGSAAPQALVAADVQQQRLAGYIQRPSHCFAIGAAAGECPTSGNASSVSFACSFKGLSAEALIRAGR